MMVAISFAASGPSNAQRSAGKVQPFCASIARMRGSHSLELPPYSSPVAVRLIAFVTIEPGCGDGGSNESEGGCESTMVQFITRSKFEDAVESYRISGYIRSC